MQSILIYHILTKNNTYVRNHVCSNNVNDIIDDEKSYTALHYALNVRNNESIVKYLLHVGADPYIMSIDGDCFDIAILNNYKMLFESVITKLNATIDELYDRLDEKTYKYNMLLNNKK